MKNHEVLQNSSDEIVLPPRQREIINLLAQGYNQTEIADSLGVSFHTISTHIHKPDYAKGQRIPLLQRLNAKTTSQAIAQGYIQGLIDVESAWKDIDLSKYETLSNREKDVFNTVTDLQSIGMGMVDVAQELGVSTRTVIVHNNSIYKKLDLRNKNHAVTFRFAYMAAELSEE